MIHYNILIIGHADYPKGVKSMLEFVAGLENIDFFNLDDEKNTIDKLKSDLTKYFKKNPNTLVFADILGGSPHRIAVEKITELNSKEVIVVIGASPSLMMDLGFKFKLLGVTSIEEAKQLVEEKNKNFSKYTMTFTIK